MNYYQSCGFDSQNGVDGNDGLPAAAGDYYHSLLLAFHLLGGFRLIIAEAEGSSEDIWQRNAGRPPVSVFNLAENDLNNMIAAAGDDKFIVGNPVKLNLLRDTPSGFT